MAKRTKAPKAPSMKKVARIYRKNHKIEKVKWDGARKFDQFGQDSAVGSQAPSKNTYKPKAKSITLGGTNRKGKGDTKRKTGRA